MAATALLAVALLLVRVNTSLDDEMSTKQATVRIHTEKTVAVRRAARRAYVALLERRLSSAEEHALEHRNLEAALWAARDASREFAVLKSLSDAEKAASTRFRAAVTAWSNGMDQALRSSDGDPISIAELSGRLDAIDATSDAVLEMASNSATRRDDRVATLRRAHLLVQAAFGLLALGILGLAFVGCRRAIASERARVEQVQAGRLRAQFFANISHELRTPLIAIRGLATTIDELEHADDALHRAARLIDSEAEELLGVINNILDASKLDAGKMQLLLEDVALASVLERPMQRCRALLGAKPIELSMDVPADLPKLRTDVVKLQQVITNLLTNAIKFTDHGSVKLTARKASKGRLVIEISDTGIGIRPEALERIWKPFEQDDAGTSRRFGGSGLGLAIVRSILELLDGKVSIRSTLGIGTQVSVVLATGSSVARGPSHSEAVSTRSFRPAGFRAKNARETCDTSRE